jgi:hypothetical protein
VERGCVTGLLENAAAGLTREEFRGLSPHGDGSKALKFGVRLKCARPVSSLAQNPAQANQRRSADRRQRRIRQMQVRSGRIGKVAMLELLGFRLGEHWRDRFLWQGNVWLIEQREVWKWFDELLKILKPAFDIQRQSPRRDLERFPAPLPFHIAILLKDANPKPTQGSNRYQGGGSQQGRDCSLIGPGQAVLILSVVFH